MIYFIFIMYNILHNDSIVLIDDSSIISILNNFLIIYIIYTHKIKQGGIKLYNNKNLLINIFHFVLIYFNYYFYLIIFKNQISIIVRKNNLMNQKETTKIYYNY